MWEKAKQYLHKMGGIILVASILIWFLGYFPRQTPNSERFEREIATWEQVIAVSREGETVAIAPEAVERINADTERDNYMRADEACAYGLVDKVISSRNDGQER